MLYILLEKGQTTANELSKLFEVSIRTVYRDVEALNQAGIPIYAIQGKGGGISLTDNFILNKALLTDKEQDEILLALQSLSALQYPGLDDLFLKLSSFFNRNNNNWIEIDFSSWGYEKKQNESFNLIKKSILQKKFISFNYYNTKGEKSNRQVAPEKLLFKKNAWYLQGYCFNKMEHRTFKITRITNPNTVENNTIENIERFPQDESISSEVAPSASSIKNIHLLIKISSAGAYRVYDDFEENEITINADGSFTISANFPDGEWIFNYLLSFGTLLEVLEPISVRTELTNHIKILAATYQI